MRENDESRDRALTRVTEKATKVVARRQSVKCKTPVWFQALMTTSEGTRK